MNYPSASVQEWNDTSLGQVVRMVRSSRALRRRPKRTLRCLRVGCSSTWPYSSGLDVACYTYPHTSLKHDRHSLILPRSALPLRLPSVVWLRALINHVKARMNKGKLAGGSAFRLTARPGLKLSSIVSHWCSPLGAYDRRPYHSSIVSPILDHRLNHVVRRRKRHAR